MNAKKHTSILNKILNKTINTIILCFLFNILFCYSYDNAVYAQQKKQQQKKAAPKKTTAKSKSKSKPKPKPKAKKKTPQKAKSTPIRKVQPNAHIFLKDSLLADGISYKQLYLTINGIKHSVHILQVDLINNKTEINVVKGGNNITELERLPIMLDNSNVDTSQRKIIGGINANFWRAYTNYPIGPTIINGEIAEMPSYKKWTSTFFNEDGVPFTNFFDIQGELITKNIHKIDIISVNRRTSQDGLVLYNRFGGDVIPYINSKKVEELLLAGLDNVFQGPAIDDSTESVETLALYKDNLLEAQRESNLEYDMKKLILKYVDEPAVNAYVRCEVIGFDSGTTRIPENGCVLSIGNDIDFEILPKVGDRVNIHFWTNVNESEIFINSVCGTPRLVRDGMARHEAFEEGSTQKRFINGALPRTAIGYDKEKTKFYMVIVDNKRNDGTIGASLTQLADIMEYIGCYAAQNLDGGGSSNMVLGGENIINPINSRKLSVALSAVSLRHEKVSGLRKKRR